MIKVVVPGSFDPITMGHMDIISRASALYDEVTVLVTGNPQKSSGWFTIDERMELIAEAVKDMTNVKVDTWAGLLVDYTRDNNINLLVKGLRTSLDYEYELPMAQMNRKLTGIDTAFFMTDPKWGYISSTLSKEVTKFGGHVGDMLPPNVTEAMEKRRHEKA